MRPGPQGGAAWRLRAALLAAIAALAVSLGLLALSWLRPDPPPTTVRFTYPTPDLDWGDVMEGNLAVSPDGSAWVYRSSDFDSDGSRLMLRRLDDDEPVPIPGTEGATNPFFSPDGRHLGFTRGKELLRIEPFQGSPRVLATVDEEGGCCPMAARSCSTTSPPPCQGAEMASKVTGDAKASPDAGGMLARPRALRRRQRRHRIRLVL